MKNFIKYIFLIGFIYCAISDNKKNYIQNFLDKNQNKKNGLFFENTRDVYKSTKEAIELINMIKNSVKLSEKICENIKNDNVSITYEVIKINEYLNCGKDIKKKPNFNLDEINDIRDLHEALITVDYLNISDEKIFNDYYDALQNFFKNNKFSVKKNGKNRNIYATGLGLEMLNILYNHLPKKEKEIKDTIKEIINILQNSLIDLSDNMNIFSEKDVSILKLNEQLLKSLKAVKKISSFRNFNEYLFKLLNYVKNFNYLFYDNIDNLYSEYKILESLYRLPLMKLKNNNYNYDKSKTLTLNFVNSFDDEVEIKNTTITYQIKDSLKKKSSENSKNNNFDIDDQEDDNSNTLKTKTKEIKNPTSNIELELNDMIKKPGFYDLELSMDNKYFDLKEKIIIPIISYNTIKVDHLTFEFEDRFDFDKNEKEITIKYPEQSSKVVKATQDGIFKIRVKITDLNDKPMNIEQVFLKLKNNVLNKSFNSYSNYYDSKNGYHYITFELDDPNNIESYNGMYDMILTVSDIANENPIEWNFGKTELTFLKPTSPDEEKLKLFNNVKPIMIPSQPQLISKNEHYVIGCIASVVIVILTFILLITLKKNNANVSAFPTDKIGALFNLLFIGVLGLISFILYLFWVKLNILQTLKIFVIIFFPCAIIVYQSLKTHKIDV
jgi:hypothetical protein